MQSFSHLARSGQRACSLPVSIIVPPQWSPVPQRAFLLWSVIHNPVLLAGLSLKSIEIHSSLHGRVVLKAPSCPAAAALQWLCGPALLWSHKQNVSKRKSTSCDACGGPTSADLQAYVPYFLFTSFNFYFLRSLKRKKERKQRRMHELIPLQTVPFLFAVLAIRFMVCQKSAMHDKLQPHSTSLTPASTLSHSLFPNGLSFSLSPVFCQAGRFVSWGQTKGWFSLGPVSRSPQTDSMGHWAEGIRHGRIKWKSAHAHTPTNTHTHRSRSVAVRTDRLKKTELWCTHFLWLQHWYLQMVHSLAQKKEYMIMCNASWCCPL